MLTSEILAAIRREVVDTVTEFDDALIDYVNQAIREAEEGHNFRHMEAAGSYVTVLNTRLLTTKPTYWKEAREAPYLTANDGRREEIDLGASLSDMVRMYGTSATYDTGKPQFIYETESTLEVYPLPDGNSDWTGGLWRVTVPYWEYSVDLDDEDDGVTNWWATNKPWFVIYQTAALVLAGIRDVENAAVKAQFAANILRKAKGKDKRSRLPERMTLSISRGAYAPGLRPRRGPYRNGGYLP